MKCQLCGWPLSTHGAACRASGRAERIQRISSAEELDALLVLRIPGKPKGAARPRFVRLGNGHVRTHMPSAHVEAETSAMLLLQSVWGGRDPLNHPVGLTIDVVLARPKSLCRKVDPTGRIRCTSKPDADNAAKLYMDALTKAGVLIDDTRVAELVVRKWYTAVGEQPGVELVVRGLAP